MNVIYHTSKRGIPQGQSPRGILRKRCSFPSFNVWYHILILVRGTGKPVYFSFLPALCCRRYMQVWCFHHKCMYFGHQTAGQENLCIFHSSPALCCQKYMQVWCSIIPACIFDIRLHDCMTSLLKTGINYTWKNNSILITINRMSLLITRYNIDTTSYQGVEQGGFFTYNKDYIPNLFRWNKTVKSWVLNGMTPTICF